MKADASDKAQNRAKREHQAPQRRRTNQTIKKSTTGKDEDYEMEQVEDEKEGQIISESQAQTKVMNRARQAKEFPGNLALEIEQS